MGQALVMRDAGVPRRRRRALQLHRRGSALGTWQVLDRRALSDGGDQRDQPRVRRQAIEGRAVERHEPLQPFERGRSTGAPGLGLGLYITRKIVEAHGGEIELTSAVGEGTTIRFVAGRFCSCAMLEYNVAFSMAIAA